MKNTLTLKSNSKINPIESSHALPIQIQAGRPTKKGKPKASSALLSQLTDLIHSSSKAFIQMRNGTGYCGLPVQLEDGWLTMTSVSIHGTKQTASTPTILIQIYDGAFIAHLHPVDSTNSIGTK
jgi:hypothetical protein